MDKNEAIKIAQRYLASVNSKFPVQNAFLFGSFVKGTNHPDSDIDIALVFDKVDDIIDLQIQLMQIRTDDDLLIEPHPFRRSEFHPNIPIVAEITKNGIEIFNPAA
ncbi:MAG: nucleotidyltransferase domain-containing protein [Bacteroidales bacterium]|jgi:uncharacterized protein|nr:nucleotidyltransferase domain-containing protein [Bacteroidales bacterium]